MHRLMYGRLHGRLLKLHRHMLRHMLKLHWKLCRRLHVMYVMHGHMYERLYQLYVLHVVFRNMLRHMLKLHWKLCRRLYRLFNDLHRHMLRLFKHMYRNMQHRLYRLWRQRLMEHKTLCLDLTTDCNMSCPWCIAKPLKDKLQMGGYLSAEVEKKLKDHISNVPHLLYSFHGGECTLYPEKMLEMMDYIRQENPAGKIRLFTNGSLLTAELVTQLNERDVDCVIGVGLTGYKTILNMVKHAKEPYNLISNIHMLKHKTIRVVPDRHDAFAYECIALHDIFLCPVEVTHDYATLKDWDNKAISTLKGELDILVKKGHATGGWFGIMCASMDMCDCPHENIHFFVDGTLGRSTQYHADYVVEGCAMLHKLMPAGIYENYINTIKEYVKELKAL